MGRQWAGLWHSSAISGGRAAAVVPPYYVLLAEVVPPVVAKQGTAGGVPLYQPWTCSTVQYSIVNM